MTSARLQEIRNAIPFVPIPFASSGICSNPSENSVGGNKINWNSGIPPSYASSFDEGGKFALLGDVNAIGKYASQEPFLMQHGLYHTFSQDVANLIGGYPYGAFLKWYQPQTGLLRWVRCIKPGGNCFSPIDDDRHGIASSDPFWSIADDLDKEIGSGSFQVSGEFQEDPYYMIWMQGKYGLFIKNQDFDSAEVHYSNTWIAPFDCKIVSEKTIPNPLGYFNRPGFQHIEPYVFPNLPNPCALASSVNMYRLYCSVKLIGLDGASKASMALLCCGPTTNLNNDGVAPPIHSMYLRKGEGMRIELKNLVDDSFHGVFSLQYKFKVWKV